MKNVQDPSNLRPNHTVSRRQFVASAAGGAVGTAIVSDLPFIASASAEVVLSETATIASANHLGVQASVAALAFLSSLNESQTKIAHLGYDDLSRVQWNFVPMTDRKGLPLKDMDSIQSELALNLLKSIVSDDGFRRSEMIMQYEGVLREQEGPKSASRRDPKKYHFTIYGDPSAESTWAVSIEGHHLSLNIVFEKGHMIDSTPQFFGANPATFQSNMLDRFEKGFQLLQDEEQLGWDLLNSLSKEQRSITILKDKAPTEIDAPGAPQAIPTTLQGIPAAGFNESQKSTLLNLLAAYCKSLPEPVLENRMKLIKAEGLEKVFFAWLGASKPGIGHYYKVQGPTFLVEFINVQNDAIGNVANHIHCVWRDLQGDFNLPANS